MTNDDELFAIRGCIAAVTGGGGVLAGCMARELARRGVKVAVLDLSGKAARDVADSIVDEGGQAIALVANVLEKDSLQEAASRVVERFGGVDFLINAAGGNKKEATTTEELTFFDLPTDALRFVLDLNLLGSILPSQVFGRLLVERKQGVIINISSMNSFRPLTKIVGYSAAKAAINNFTQWLAVHVAQNYSPGIRVNAIAPGFFETAQNKFLLRDEKTGDLTARGTTIIDHTPAARFGVAEDLLGTLLWLISPGAAFVSGIVVPVDGGFSAFSGV